MGRTQILVVTHSHDVSHGSLVEARCAEKAQHSASRV